MSRTPTYDAEKAPATETARFLPVPPAPIAKQELNLPPGIHAIYRCFKLKSLGSVRFFQIYTLIITYILYCTYHLSRKPFSVVKNELHKDCSKEKVLPANFTGDRNGTWCSWEPFDGPDYKELFGQLNFAYWMSYAVVMFFVGGIADRSNLRHFVTAGMICAGIFTVAFGMAKIWKIHALSYFIFIQIICGFFQATGWPVMVALVGNWFGKSKRGLIFGIWNSHSSVGNILGTASASYLLTYDWALSFIVPGITIIVGAVIAFLFIIIKPTDAGFEVQNVAVPLAHDTSAKNGGGGEKEEIRLVEKSDGQVVDVTIKPKDEDAVGFLKALRIPGVVEFAICLFFSKAVSYVFLLWLPKIIKDQNEALGSANAGYLSILYDIGGITGGIVAGGISDFTGARGMVAFAMAVMAVPVLYLFLMFGATDLGSMVALLIACGICVVGPYALITTAVSADLGSSLAGKSKALATVTGIINGTGSFGSALGPLAVGFISSRFHGWNEVFYCLMGAQIIAALCLTRVVFREIVSWRNRRTTGVTP